MPKRPSAPGAYACATCKKTFSRRADLQRHVQGSHERTRSYQCLFCPYTTPQDHNCVRHMRTVHDKPNEVPLLLLKFEIPDSLTSSVSTSRSTTPGSSFSAGSLPDGFYSTPNLGIYSQLYLGSLSLPASGSSTPDHLPRSRSAPVQPNRYSLRPSPYPVAHSARSAHHQRHSTPEIASPALAGSAPQPRSLSLDAQLAVNQPIYWDPLLDFFGLPQVNTQPSQLTSQPISPMPSAPLSELPDQFPQPDVGAVTPILAVGADNSHIFHSQNTLAEVSSVWVTFEEVMQQGLPSLEELSLAASFD